MAEAAKPNPEPKPEPKPRSVARAARSAAPEPLVLDPSQHEAVRDLFWFNIVREMLTGLMSVGAKHPEMLDGRFAVLTHGGERIPIAAIKPIFDYTASSSVERRRASLVVQMTVFRIATPDGEAFTLPLHEIRGFHELTPELLTRIQEAEAEAAAADPGAAKESRPFGFAAFSALPRLPDRPAPMHPME